MPSKFACQPPVHAAEVGPGKPGCSTQSVKFAIGESAFAANLVAGVQPGRAAGHDQKFRERLATGWVASGVGAWHGMG